MRIFLKILESDKKLENSILEELSIEINSRVRKNLRATEFKMKVAIGNWIRQQPEVADMLANGTPGSLNAQLGFPAGQAGLSINSIIDAVVNSISFDIKPLDRKLRGRIEINIQPSTFFNVLNLPAAVIFAESGPLNWLSWMLKEGTKTIVFDYEYKPSKFGRSGGGYMKKGGIWRIPPQFAGTTEDNFITRAFRDREDELSQILQGIFF